MLFINAIKFRRIDLIQEIFENCFYLPQLARRDSSTINLTLSLQEE